MAAAVLVLADADDFFAGSSAFTSLCILGTGGLVEYWHRVVRSHVLSQLATDH